MVSGAPHAWHSMLPALAGKTTLSAPGGIALGFGPGPGLASAFFYNGIGSLFSSYRPSVARLHVFTANDPRQPLMCHRRMEEWQPGVCRAVYTLPSLEIAETRFATQDGLACQLELHLPAGATEVQSFLLCFHGQVEQWPFFDYQLSRKEPEIELLADAKRGNIELRQPHPHAAYEDALSLQLVTASLPFCAYGFGQSEADLRAVWQDHGCEESLRMRLGQVGGRITSSKARFLNRRPLYYFVIRADLRPGETLHLAIQTEYRQAEHHGSDQPGNSRQPSGEMQLANQLRKDKHRWDAYFQDEVPELECGDETLENYWYYVWYVLRANRMAPGAHIKHAFTAPSKYMYWGPWIWDGYFHALGEMWMRDGEVAADTIRAVLDMQFPNGYIPVCSGTDRRMCFHEAVPGYKIAGGGGYASYPPGEIEECAEGKHGFEAAITPRSGEAVPHPGRTTNGISPTLMNEKTQTPLITLAAAEYARLRGGAEFAREVLQPLLAYDDWLWRRRSDAMGRFILWHGDESGWDNATRHYPVPALPFDVQVHCILHRAALCELCVLAQDGAALDVIRERQEWTLRSIESYWDKDKQWYCDLAPKGRGAVRRPQVASSGLFALMLDIPSERVRTCIEYLCDPQHFAAPQGLPTLSQSDPDYAPHGWGWNGPSWLQVSYFTLLGLLKHRRFDEAFALWEQTLGMLIRDGKPSSYEMYDPHSGEGIGCPDYSWQAMVLHLIIRHFAGVDFEALRPALPPGMHTLRISNLAGAVKNITIARSERELRISVKYSASALPLFDSAAFTDFATVSANGVAMSQGADKLWSCAMGTKPAKQWEIIAQWR